ncbi:MAG: CNNM domain-containing protein [Halanaeroarchaeum sp.]
MVGLETAVRLVGGLALLLSNGVFVTTEFAMTRIRQFPREEFQTAGLERAWEMTERLEIYLSGCQVGITISSIGLGVVAEPAVAAVFAALLAPLGMAAPGSGHTALAVILSFGLINLLHVVVGEQAPTYLGIERTKFVARYGAPILYWWTKAMYPVITLSDRLAKWLLGLFGVEIARSWAEEEEEVGEPPTSRAELREQMGDALQGVGVSPDRRDEIINALAIGDMPVADVMVPREDIVFVSTTDDLATNVDRMAEAPHVRFPLVGDALEEFEGIVYTPDVLKHVEDLSAGTLDLRAIAAPPMTVTPETVVSDLIDRFQAENQEMALVIDDETVVGLVTATDAFEQITGQLEDPMDVAREGTAD